MGEWADVLTLDPTVEHPDLLDHDLDLYHMARRRAPSLEDLGRAYRGGVPTVNPYASARSLVDRVECTRLLDAGGITVPRYRYTEADGIEFDTPVIGKPRYELGPSRHDFETSSGGSLDFEGERLIQEYVPHTRAIKLYRLGSETRAVEGTEASRQPTRACEPTGRLLAVADRVQRVTGAELFEVDVIDGEELYVVDVNAAVSMRGVPDGCDVYEALLRRKAGEPEPLSEPLARDRSEAEPAVR